MSVFGRYAGSLLCIAALAAPPQAAIADPQPEEEDRSYANLVFATDGIAGLFLVPTYALLGAGHQEAGEVVGWAYFGTASLGVPLVHAVHGNLGRAFGSLGIRLIHLFGLSLLGSVLGSAIGDPSPGENPPELFVGSAIGVLIGHGTAMLLDALVFAQDWD